MLDLDWARHVTVDGRPKASADFAYVEPREELHDLPIGLLVQLRTRPDPTPPQPCRGGRGSRVGEAELVGQVLEERPEKLSGSPRSAIHPIRNIGYFGRFRPEVVGAPRRVVRHDVEAGLLHLLREGLEVSLRVGHVRPRDVSGYQKSIFTGSVSPACCKSCFDFAGSNSYCGTVSRPAEDSGRLELRRHLAEAAVERVHDLLAVDGVRAIA